MSETIYDVVVIGAGLFGSAAAKYLAKGGLRTLIIGPGEPLDTPRYQGVFGSHYDEARITRIVDPDPVWGKLAVHALAQYTTIEAESGVTFHHKVGCLHVTEPQNEVVSNAEYTVLNSTQITQQFPYFHFPPNADAVWERGAAGYINPRKLVQAQLIIAQNSGALLARQTLEKLVPENNAITIVTREGKNYYAAKVLLAAGAYTKFLLKDTGDLLSHPMQVTLAEVETPIHEMPSLIYPLNHPRIEGIYLLPPICYPDGKWYIKIGAHPHPVHLAEQESELSDWFHGEPADQETQDIKAILREITPQIKVLSYRTLPCADTYTADGYPSIKILENEDAKGRIGMVTGGNGRGAKSSDAIGKLGAELFL